MNKDLIKKLQVSQREEEAEVWEQSRWGIGVLRATWGMKASFFPLLNRIALSFTWSANMHNPFPASTAMDGADFLCFVLFLLISLPLLYIPPEHYRIPFLFTSVIATVCSFTLFIWSLARAHGGGPLIGSEAMSIVGVEKARGAALGWAMVYGISSQMGQICAGVSSQWNRPWLTF
ncbi:uncharacterized protein IL334_007956 [Kwoniella shivajii]|uniref:Uncharacterized protein n=1 Tax=Kwoniella shivajii TaxID=564305 RepID=A0ABZ1DA42_9TREE|nr:hypothetical protein IL334_007956 [Kwoniella shivajii]